MKKINKKDLDLKIRTVSDLNSGNDIVKPASPAPTSKLDCITMTSCVTECEQANCPNYSEHLRTCNETFATRCLCGGDSDNCNTLGCGSQTGGGICCDTGGTCDNCGQLSVGNCDSQLQVCETEKLCFVSIECETKQPDCYVYTKNGEGEISVCACMISEGLDECISNLGNCNQTRLCVGNDE